MAYYKDNGDLLSEADNWNEALDNFYQIADMANKDIIVIAFSTYEALALSQSKRLDKWRKA
jgi:hypothetical protein